MKKLSILALTATIAITPAFAEVNSYATPSVIQSAVSLDDMDTPATTSQADLSFAFDDVENLQVKEMTVAQMQETEGAVAPIVVYGLTVGSRIMYVGITNNLARRTMQHATTKAFTGVRQLGSSPTRNGARVLEQNNINRYNTINQGWNKRNSIAPSNPLSKQVTIPYGIKK